MKKLFLKLLKFCLNKFQDEVLSNIHNTTAVITTQLIFERTALLTDALLDSDPNDSEQVKTILRTTLVSDQFTKLEQAGIASLVEKIKDENLAKVVIGTETLRLEILKVLADENPDNGTQLKDLITEYTESEEFAEYVSLLAMYLINKKIKNGRNSK